MAPMSKEDLWKEWLDQCDHWEKIYRWSRCTGLAYAESIAEWIVQNIDSIKLQTEGLRDRSFRSMHFGQAKLKDDNKETNEKMLCRAAFNQRYIDGLGVVLDYELPLKEIRGAGHGDVDLVCLRENRLLCVEVKRFNSCESALKGLIEAFVYSRLLQRKIEQLRKDFYLNKEVTIQPVYLTFPEAKSYEQLISLPERSKIPELIEAMNRKLKEERIEPIQLKCGTINGEYCGSPWDRLSYLEEDQTYLIRFKANVSLSTETIKLG